MTDDATNAGWFPAPDDRSLLRYWDGEVWTDQTRRAPGAGGVVGVPGKHVVKSEEVRRELADGEHIAAGFRASTGMRTAWVVATEQRVFCVKRKGFKGTVTTTFDYETIIVGLGGNGVSIVGPEGEFTLWGSVKHAMHNFVAYVESHQPRSVGGDFRGLPRPDSASQVVAPMPDGGTVAVLGTADELRKLADLRSEGVLTGDEFETLKARLIDMDGNG